MAQGHFIHIVLATPARDHHPAPCTIRSLRSDSGYIPAFAGLNVHTSGTFMCSFLHAFEPALPAKVSDQEDSQVMTESPQHQQSQAKSCFLLEAQDWQSVCLQHFKINLTD